ncbi:glucose/galactose MFS transporter [Emticicia sp. CRIBPO]|uniref:sugar MFS transporter n=1 Tax=Emticicia sp. CRIBPO TaxID=2683258 RepID=UPI001411FF85|nr:sugar MFS transporter [Emticicia sp. CRIBPO]NBA84252.1 glucose/galactose MFS transporter [Emticicia sp. CRIBPO]
MKQTKPDYFVPLVMMGILFFAFGYITWTNGTLIPFLKIACELETDTQAFLVTSAFYMSYFFLAIPSSVILNKIGFKSGMILGLVIVALGSLIFIPAANQRAFPLFLTGLFVQGMGLALLQTAVNPYLSILGPIEAAAKRISIMGIANKIAGMLAPLILGATLLKGADGLEKKVAGTADATEKANLLNELVNRIQTPYIYLAVILILIAVLFYFIQLPEVEEESDIEEDTSKTKKSIFSHPNIVLGVLALILYVAAEVIAGDGIIQYGRNIGISLDEAKNFTTYTLGAMLVGYLIGIVAIPKYIKQEDALKYSAISGVLFSLVAIFSSGYTSVFAIALMGLSNALMWPAIFPLSIKGLGKLTKLGSALLIMGIGPGGGVIPLLYAELGGPANPQRGFWIMVFCYLYILYFATAGHKKKSW